MDSTPLENERLASQGTAPGSLMPAILAGLGAALIGAIIWTAVVGFTGYEVGYIAWALGGMVGFGMSHATSRRDSSAAAAAATLALVGLLLARVMIGEFVLGSSGIDEVLEDDELMTQAAALDLQFTGGFPPDLQARYDAIPVNDTLSDAIWEEMLVAARAHLELLSEQEKVEIAEQFTGMALVQAGMVGRVTAQMGAFDLLWIFLAVSTAWSMLKREEEVALQS